MRRTPAVLTLAVALAVAAGCGSTKTPVPAPAATSASPSPSPTPSADYTADTKKICDEFGTLVDTEMKRFGEAAVKMMLYNNVGNATQAAKAKTNVQNVLRKFAGNIRTTTAKAQNPALREAGEEAATNVETTAADGKVLDKLKTPDDLDKVLKPEFTSWIVPLGVLCG
ncbi:hypothetical protein [Micromonospora sp. NPDC049679]|uniref:hypothetical protein n=1 Tax=Micromonospora sp. NPDC049679 TaxID=3155920 RepID=UPI00340DF3E5